MQQKQYIIIWSHGFRTNFKQLSLVEGKFLVDGVTIGRHRGWIVVKQSDEYPIGRSVGSVAGTMTSTWSLVCVPVTAGRTVPTPPVLVAIPEEWVLHRIGVGRALVVPVVLPPPADMPVASTAVVRSARRLLAVNGRRTAFPRRLYWNNKLGQA